MNPLPLIAAYLRDHPGKSQFHLTPRRDVLDWLAGRNPPHDIQLAADCLAAAGIGREQEQTATVYCRATHC